MRFCIPARGGGRKGKASEYSENKFGLTINRRKETEYAKLCNHGEV